MLTSGINFKNFKKEINSAKIKQTLVSIIKEKNEVIKSLSKNYKNSFDKKKLKKYKSSSNFRIIGMGGSTLGAQSIYDFLSKKIKKNFLFIDNLQVDQKKIQKKKIYKFSYFKIR